MERYGIPYGTIRLWQAHRQRDEKHAGGEEDGPPRQMRAHSDEEKGAGGRGRWGVLGTSEAAEKHGVTPQTIRAWLRERRLGASLRSYPCPSGSHGDWWTGPSAIRYPRAATHT